MKKLLRIVSSCLVVIFILSVFNFNITLVSAVSDVDEATLSRTALRTAVPLTATSLQYTDETLTLEQVLARDSVATIDDGVTNKHIYVWSVGTDYYYWSDASSLYFPADSTYLFGDYSTSKQYYSALTTLDVSHFNSSRVTTMAHMFDSLPALPALDVSMFDTSNVTNMSYMFSNCKLFTSLAVSGFNVSNVTDMSGMFYGCSKLATINLSNFVTTNCTDMKYMFYNCSKLMPINVSGFDTQNVTSMKSMFQGCSSLTSLDVTHFNTRKVTDMNGMFQMCSKLPTINLSSFVTSACTDMGYMFNNCSGLTSLDVINFDTSNVTNMRYMFCNCTKLPSIDVSHFNTRKVMYMQYMFSNCSKMPVIDCSNFDTSEVRTMQRMFQLCLTATKIDVSHFNTSRVSDFSEMFKSCSAITRLHLESFSTTTTLSITFDGMFSTCTVLERIYADDSKFKVGSNKATNMFEKSPKIIGGSGTVWNSSIIDGTYAKNDHSFENPGYFYNPSILYYDDTTYFGHDEYFDGVGQFYDIPDKSDEKVFKGWYYDREQNNDSHPVDYENDAFSDDMKVAYAHWIDNSSIDKDEHDTNVVKNNKYKAFDLAGVQIRSDGQYDPNIQDTRDGGIRFVASIGEDLLSAVDALSSKEVSDGVFTGPLEYGFVATKKTNVTNWLSMAKTHYDMGGYKLGYLDANVNGKDTTKRNKNFQGFMKNINCTSRDYSSQDISDHRNFDKYRLATFVVTYGSDSQNMKDTDIAVRAYLRYYDANGLLRTFYDNYNGTSYYGGVATNYNNVEQMLDPSGDTTPVDTRPDAAYISASKVNDYVTYLSDDVVRFVPAPSGVTLSDVKSAGGTRVDDGTNDGEIYLYILDSTVYYWTTAKNLYVNDASTMFAESGLEYVDLTGMDFSSVTTMDYMFWNCGSLETVLFDDSKIISPTNCCEMFYMCYELDLIDLSMFDTRSVTSMCYMFRDTGLRTIYVSDLFVVPNGIDTRCMFLYSYSLVGGNGTVYSEAHADGEYARIDTDETPGYFTSK